MRTLNLGILAHVDAGKTSLTERLLFAAGVIDEIGSVDEGSTQTDSLALEQKRGITIKSAVVSFVIDDVSVNLIDTPGHPDFIAEVERVLSVLDGAVLVISAVEGVQAQTRVLMRTLHRLKIPTLIFVNKIDRVGAQAEQLLRSISARLTPAIIAMGSPHDLGIRSAGFIPYGEADPAFASALADSLAEQGDSFLAAFLDDTKKVSYHQLRAELAAQTKHALVHPVFFGSAITGAGTDSLIAAVTELLPTKEGDADSPVSGAVFKIERGLAGDKIAYVRMFAGTVRVRDRLRFRVDQQGGANEGKVTAISVFERGSAVRHTSVSAGQIGKLWGLGDIQIGDEIRDVIGDEIGHEGDGIGGPQATRTTRHFFAPPTLETVILPRHQADKGALHAALAQLAEQDPLINLRQDDVRQEIFASLYGEVQKEVIQATLESDYDIEVEFRETTTICIERLVGSGAAVEIIAEAPNPFLATVGLRVDPAAIGSGVEFRLEVELGAMPLAFFKAVKDTVKEALGQGIHGWQVTDCTVTMTRSGYWARQSTAHGGFDKSMSSTSADFRSLTPLVLIGALKQAKTVVCEPIHHFQLDIPADTLGAILPALSRLQAVPQSHATRGSSYTLEGEIPAARVHQLQQQLATLTRGEGVLESAFERYQPVAGSIPTRPRTDHDPLNREEYLRRMARRA